MNDALEELQQIDHLLHTRLENEIEFEIPELEDIEHNPEEYDTIDLAELVLERERIASQMSEEDIIRHMITNFLRNEDLLLTERLEIIQTAPRATRMPIKSDAAGKPI